MRIWRLIGLAVLGGIMLVGCGSPEPEEGMALEAQIAPVKYNRDAIVTIMSDDGFDETGAMLNELGGKHQIKITVSGIVEYVEPCLKQWQEWEKKGNIELISHSYTHLSMGEEADVSEEDLKHEISDSIAFYRQHFRTDQIAFTPPETQMCERGYEILADNGIRAVRQGDSGYNTLELQMGHESGQWYNLKTFGIGNVSTTEERNAWIDGAVENHAWLIEMWHDVTTSGKRGFYQEISYDAADEHLSYIEDRREEGRIWTASMVEAVKYLTEKEYAKVNAVFNGSRIRVTLICDTEELPSDVYGEPLTIRIAVPEETVNFTKAVSLDRKNKVRILQESGKTYLELEMAPNDKDVIIKLK